MIDAVQYCSLRRFGLELKVNPPAGDLRSNPYAERCQNTQAASSVLRLHASEAHSSRRSTVTCLGNPLRTLARLVLAYNPAIQALEGHDKAFVGTPSLRTRVPRAGISMLLKNNGDNTKQKGSSSSEDASVQSPPTRTPQVLRLLDATTQQEIRIVGTFHNNPASIALAKEEVVTALKQHKQLGALVVESCPSRWNRSFADFPPGSLVARLTPSEMHTAASIAVQNDVPVMLGDTDVSDLTDRVKQLAKPYLYDLINPFTGWRPIIRDLRRTVGSNMKTKDIAQSKLLLDGEAPLSIADFIKPELLMGLLSTWLRYPFVIALQAPIPYLIFALLWLVLKLSETGLEDSWLEFQGMAKDALLVNDDYWTYRAQLVSFWNVGSAVNVLLLRTFLVAILEERNAQLARAIRRAATEQKAPVVAILGGVHVNGVARLLMSQDYPTADGRDTDGVWWKMPPDMDPKEWL